MGWEETLFGAVHRRLRAVMASVGRGRTPPRPGGVDTVELAPRLECLASLLVGERVDVKRFDLPARFEAGDDTAENERVAIARVARGAAALRLGLVWADDTTRAAATRLAEPLLRATLIAELPGAEALLDEADAIAVRRRPPAPESSPGAAPTDLASLRRAVGALGKGTRVAATLESLGGLPRPAAHARAMAEPTLTEGEGAAGTEREGGARKAKRVELGEEKLDENPITHSFEKVHTAEEYRGGQKRADGADDLADHAGALDELDLDSVTRSGERARSLYRADLEIEGATGDVAGIRADDAIPYDEWDAAAGCYRPGFCAVRERTLPGMPGAEDWTRAVLARNRVQLAAIQADFARIAATRVWRGRQLDGPEVDHDAMADRHAALRGGQTPPEHLYANRRRHSRDLAVHLLLDASLSSDAWVANHRVLDVAREAIVVLGEALRTERIETEVAAFRSHTRLDCRFDLIKGFDEAWTTAGGRLLALRPDGYTRIGPALRHATTRLSARGARRRLLVLLSDSKPTDYDRYEGRHGLADVERAVGEARRQGIVLRVLTIDAAARAHLPRMFGRAGFEILPRPDVLPRALSTLFAELAR
jgi:nitric oxide reductase NorD protein